MIAERIGYDLSTINLTELEKLPVYTLPPTYRLQDDPGNGCYLDPPGYPTYFTRSVYTSHGNSPRKGAETVIFGRVLETSNDWRPGDDWDTVSARRNALMKRLYMPLPFEHPRVQAWVVSVMTHSAHCYRDTERLEYGKPGTLIYPVPDYKLKTPRIDPHWTPEYTATVQAEADAFNKQEIERATRIATLDNHIGVQQIREFYPDFTPPTDWLTGSGLPIARLGDWWERYAERPTPAECTPPKWFGAHRSQGWCQFCGSVDNKQ
jgi:hypothetical protein